MHQTNRLVILFTLACGSAFSQSALPECFVQLSGYDASGIRSEPLLVRAVRLADDRGFVRKADDLLRGDLDSSPVVARGNRIYFGRDLLGLYPVRVEVVSPEFPLKSPTLIAFESCRQYESMFLDSRKWELGEISSLMLHGQLTGCGFEGEW